MASRYSDDEVEAIFRRALERQVEDEDGFARDELIAAAREVGLDEDAIDRAIGELESERGDEELVERLRKKQRERWLNFLVFYLVFVGAFVGMNLLGFFGPWVAWVAFGLGIPLALSTFRTFRGPTEEDIEKERTRLNRKARREAKAKARKAARRQRKQEKRAREEEKRRRSERADRAGEELERVIEEGVTMLLSAAAKKLAEANAKSKTDPSSEFGKFVERKKAEARGETAPPAETKKKKRAEPPRARVEVDDDDEAAEQPRRSRRRARRER